MTDRVRRSLGARTALLGLVLALALLACGSESGEGGLAAAERLLPDPLPAASPSPMFRAPLPKGAVPGPSTDPGAEAFSVAPPVTLSEVNAFYQREMDRKPFGDFTWCGSELDEITKTVTRFWLRSGTNDYRTLVLRSATVNQPTLIVVGQRTGAKPDACP